MKSDPVRLEVFKHLFASVAEEMGVVLRRSAYSPNIKERRDFSCAIFDNEAAMIAQAAHIPVHLGSMPLSVKEGIRSFKFYPGDMVILNDPYRGGTHLPDITLVAPVFVEEELIGFVANRAHHADVGGMTPGSMPLSQEIYQEGLRIPPVKLIEGGRLKQELFDLILANVRTPEERAGDLQAQIAANRRGDERLRALVARNGWPETHLYMQELQQYGERFMINLIGDLPRGSYHFKDVMDDDGFDNQPVEIHVTVTVDQEEVTVDFSGTSSQIPGSINAVYAVTLSAVHYVFRSLISADIPTNSGCFLPIKVIAPQGTLVNAQPPAAVAGGNVETSQRIVDTVLGALAQALPDRVPAASQGTMNNITIGGWDEERVRAFAYYETVGGGQGASPNMEGADATHTHMTNTLNTPIEALEFAYPLRVVRYAIRRGSGGAGRAKGGDGIRRDLELLADATVTLLSDRRKTAPYGLAGGAPGKTGRNMLLRDGTPSEIAGKVTVQAKKGDVISVRTPGGGGHGKKAQGSTRSLGD